MSKQTEITLNYETYKSLNKSYESIFRRILKLVPREMLIEECKKRKIIKREWIKKGEKYGIV